MSKYGQGIGKIPPYPPPSPLWKVILKGRPGSLTHAWVHPPPHTHTHFSMHPLKKKRRVNNAAQNVYIKDWPSLMMFWSIKEILWFEVLLRRTEIISFCFSGALEKSPVHDAPAPLAATELNMRAHGESGEGAKCFSLNSRVVICEHSAGKKGTPGLTMPQWQPALSSVRRSQIPPGNYFFSFCFTSTWPCCKVLLAKLLTESMCITLGWLKNPCFSTPP